MKYILEGIFWCAGGTLLTYLFDKEYVLWETAVMWFVIGVVWRFWMKHPIKIFHKGNNMQ